jgi:hypothetical protein
MTIDMARKPSRMLCMRLADDEYLLLDRILAALMMLPHEQRPIRYANRKEVLLWLMREKAAAMGLSEPNP